MRTGDLPLQAACAGGSRSGLAARRAGDAPRGRVRRARVAAQARPRPPAALRGRPRSRGRARRPAGRVREPRPRCGDAVGRTVVRGSAIAAGASAATTTTAAATATRAGARATPAATSVVQTGSRKIKWRGETRSLRGDGEAEQAAAAIRASAKRCVRSRQRPGADHGERAEQDERRARSRPRIRRAPAALPPAPTCRRPGRNGRAGGGTAGRTGTASSATGRARSRQSQSATASSAAKTKTPNGCTTSGSSAAAVAAVSVPRLGRSTAPHEEVERERARECEERVHPSEGRVDRQQL